MGKLTVLSVLVVDNGLNIRFGTDIADPNGSSQTLEINLFVTKGDYLTQKEKNPSLTVKDYVVSLAKDKYATLSAMAALVTNWVGSPPITW